MGAEVRAVGSFSPRRSGREHGAPLPVVSPPHDAPVPAQAFALLVLVSKDLLQVLPTTSQARNPVISSAARSQYVMRRSRSVVYTPSVMLDRMASARSFSRSTQAGERGTLAVVEFDVLDGHTHDVADGFQGIPVHCP